MGLVDTLPVQRVRPVLFLPLWLGTLRDASGHGNHSVNSNGYWTQTGQKDAYTPRQQDGRLIVSDAPSLQFTSFSVIWWGAHRIQTGATRVISKRDSGGTQMEILAATSGSVAIFDGTNVRTRAVSLVGCTFVAVTLASGSVADLYLQGVHDGAFNGANTITVDDADLSVGGSYAPGQGWNNPLSGVALYDTVLAADEIGAWYNYTTDLLTPRLQWPAQGLDYAGATFAGEPTYVDNIQSARVSLGNETSGRLSNTGLSIVSGTWQVAEGADGRWISCVADGVLRRKLDGADTYTTARFVETGGVVLTKASGYIQLAATAGDTISALVLTAP